MVRRSMITIYSVKDYCASDSRFTYLQFSFLPDRINRIQGIFGNFSISSGVTVRVSGQR